MNNIFSQSKLIHKINFITEYKDIEILETFFPEDTLGISTYEIESETIDSKDHDLWGMDILIDDEAKVQPLIDALTDYIKNHNLYIRQDITYEVIEDKDWVTEYQKQLKPIEIGDFFITPKSGNIPCPKNKIPIYIEASRAFGTGDHSTTSLCIEAIYSLKDSKINNVLDIGTGSGILSFVAEKVWQNARITACDIEQISVKLAKENGISNNSNVHFYQNSEDDLNIDEGNDSFDLVVSNILAVPLIAMAKTIRSIVHANSFVILSGFLDYQVPDVVAAYNSAGFRVIDNRLENKWVALTLRGTSRLK